MTPPAPGAEPWGSRRATEREVAGSFEDDPQAIPENLSVDLPPAPESWLKFSVRRLIRHETAIEPASVSVGSDGITRYSLLIRTAAADNVSFEGVRCATAEWKMYAVGRQNGEWSRVPAPAWRRIEETGLNAVRYSLYKDYVCDRDGAMPADAATVVGRVRKRGDGILGQGQR